MNDDVSPFYLVATMRLAPVQLTNAALECILEICFLFYCFGGNSRRELLAR